MPFVAALAVATEASDTPTATAAGNDASGQAPSELVVTLPAGWTQKVDPASKVIFMRPPEAQTTSHSSDAELVIMPAQDFAGTAEEWHAAALRFAERDARLLEPDRNTTEGGLLVSATHLVDAAGTEQRQVVYSARWATRAQAFVFFATSPAVFAKNAPIADRAITQAMAPAGQTPVADGNDVAAPPATSMDSPPPPPGTFEPSAPGADLPAELTIEAPPGWAVQRDPKSGATYAKPPDAPSTDKAVLGIFPAVAFDGTAEQFHSQTLAAALGQGRLLEPAHHGVAGGFLATEAHYQMPKGGTVRAVVYTARWGSRAQAVVFVTARDDLFRNDALAANAAVLAVQVPGAAPAAPGAPAASATAGPGATAPPAPALASTGPNPGAGADSGDTMPVLEYADPPNFFRGGTGGNAYAEYQGSDINFTLCVYPFRESQGDIRAAFQQSLLRDWIGVMYQEEGVAGPPRFTNFTTPGADAAIGANFLDARQQEHFRLLLVSGHWAALVDMIAPTAFAYQKGFASAVQLLNSIHVGRKAAPPSLANGPGPQGAALAGLFQGMKQKTVSNLMLGAGYLSSQTALHFYLLAADGRVYRCYDFPPGGSEAAARQFDFAGAERMDPGNAGRFAVRGNQLYIRMGGPNQDEITATVTDPNTLQLDGVAYQRKF